ncbi:hypothetical protein [Eleftheria terrae]|uniref:hypothetical protein n=1 Tax=Eleftheria terrae TaxID=1597781 RepID=UPI00263B845D|nr:hypothetical protein [Eleftheria terrae]WKB55805.1 hypothetical protein N7L95_27380 [Eleftheria terrae]
MDSALFIRSYWKDLDWLQLCLRSIACHCRGFSETVVALPRSSLAWLPRCPLPHHVRLVVVPDQRDDYLGQQATKLQADLHVQADLIVHVDADCIFTRCTRPQDLAPGGRPTVLTRPVAELGRHYPWQAATAAFLGTPPVLDFMQQPPFVYPRWLYPLLREHCLRVHGMPIERYVNSQPPRGFSEFNALGGYAHRHHAAHFDFRSAGAAGAPAPHCDWHWSWGGLAPALRRQIEAALSAAEAHAAADAEAAP